MGAFVRNHAKWPVTAPDGQQEPTEPVDDRLASLRTRGPDVQVAMAVLGRRLPSPGQRTLTLPQVDLRGLSLKGAHLNGAELTSSWLDNADLTATDLSQASLVGSHLIGANLSRANLSQADLRGANLNDAILEDTVLTDAKADTSTIWPTNFNTQRRRELGVIEAGDKNPA